MDFGSQKTVAPKEFQQRLNSMSDEVETVFLPRITTLDSDAIYLSKMFTAKSLQTEAFYEIYIQDINGWRLMVTVPSANKSDFTIKFRDRAIGHAYLHYPVRVWDARMTLVDPGLHHLTPSRDAIAEFISTVSSFTAEPTSFRGCIPHPQFIIEKVLAHRVFSYDLDGMILLLDESQDLECSRQSHHKHYNFVAKADTREEMVTKHRLWWEARFETYDLTLAEQMQDRVDQMVTSMDGVGVENVGPWEFGKKQEEKEKEVALPVRIMTGNIEW
jgi:hypothetical protein